MCPHSSNCPKNTEKRKLIFKKSSNEITAKNAKNTDPKFFSKQCKSIYGYLYFTLKKPVFFPCWSVFSIEHGKPLFNIEQGKTVFFRKWQEVFKRLGVGKMCPHSSNWLTNTEKRKQSIFSIKHGKLVFSIEHGKTRNFFANNTESLFLTLFSFGLVQCPHTAVIALKTQKNENTLWKKYK